LFKEEEEQQQRQLTLNSEEEIYQSSRKKEEEDHARLRLPASPINIQTIVQKGRDLKMETNSYVCAKFDSTINSKYVKKKTKKKER
ncbi:hypothetical protein C0J52_25645, partial [Blattella germanica]